MRITRVFLVALLLVGAMSASSAGQVYEHGDFEVATLSALTWLTEQDGDDDAMVFGVPYVAPGLRMSYWTKSSLVAEFGFSLLTVSIDDDDVTAFNLEGGVSATFGSEESNIVPFISGLAGLLSFSNGDTESGFYIGGQGGVRSFINDYAALRLQVGYRHMLDEEMDISALELAVGLSFFL